MPAGRQVTGLGLCGGARLLAFAVVAVGCGRAGHEPPAPENLFKVDPVQCPQHQESTSGKITHDAYLRAHSDLTHSITVKLRELPWNPPACNGDSTDAAACLERDRALDERQNLNIKQVNCVYEAFGPPGSLSKVHPYWYEPPRLRTNGLPTPIGTAFSALALWSQIEAVAAHPYVESIQPGLGETAKLGVMAPAVPPECPPATDLPDSKLIDAAEIQGRGRLPVGIELRQSLLPAYRPCEGAEFCDDFFASGWERTIVARRMLTCVRSWIDSKLQGAAPDVAFGVADGVPAGAPPLPPFGDIAHATTAFGLALTWNEATETAKHPYVERLWMSPDLEVGQLPEGCPPNYDAPVPARECPTTREPIDGKFSAQSQAAWEASMSPNEVGIAVRRDSSLCPRPACPGRECPERTRYEERLLAEAAASQACVRAEIVALGGTVDPDVFVLGNPVMAVLTWPQIQALAAHPHVGAISPRYAGTPPP